MSRRWLGLARLRFLVYTAVIYTIGAIVGRRFDAGLYFLGLLIVYLGQLTTHVFNDYYDYDADLLNSPATAVTGGSARSWRVM